MVRLTPKAKLSSCPLNHFASAVVTATISGSDPIPSRKRDTSITVKSSVTAIITAATVQIEPNSTVDFAVPNLSMMMPPMSSTITAAIEYTEYSCPMFSSEKPSDSLSRSAIGLTASYT